MKAVVFEGVGDVRLEEVAEPEITHPTDAIVRLTASAICGTDLHLIRGTMPGMLPGTILGHEGVGIVEEMGDDVRNLDIGDRVVISPSIACGTCVYCRQGLYALCEYANPRGPRAGPAFFGGPEQSGSFAGLQAELARIPYANVGLIKLPEEISDDQAILVADIFPTGYFGADLADIHPGRTVAVFGCGPVGQLVIASAILLDAGRILAVDAVDSRLEAARSQGAEVINLDKEDPVEAIMRLTDGGGADRAVDAVGVDAIDRQYFAPDEGQPFPLSADERPQVNAFGAKADGRQSATAPALDWAARCLAKAGTLAVIGIYPQAANAFPIGVALANNITIRAGYCHHRQYIPLLLEKMISGQTDPTRIIAQLEPVTAAVEAYRVMDTRQPPWMKVALQHHE